MDVRLVPLFDDLHPICRRQFEQLAAALQAGFHAKETETLFHPFEGFRTPLRQRRLFEQEPRVTQANAWQSAHNYGMAVDFVPKTTANEWSWTGAHDWTYLRKQAEEFGLIAPIPWDLAHIEHPKAKAFIRMK